MKKTIFKDMIRAVRGRLTDSGGEILDSVPLAAHLPIRPTPTLEERMKEFVRNQIHLTKQYEGSESFDEADDFDLDEEEEFTSAHELTAAQEAFKIAPMPKQQGSQPSLPPKPPKKKLKKPEPEPDPDDDIED